MAKDKEKTIKSVDPRVSVNPERTPVLYCDSVIVTGSDDGMVFDFCQRLGRSSQVRVVSRVGMSRTHAKKLLMVLRGQIDRVDTKATSKKTVN